MEDKFADKIVNLLKVVPTTQTNFSVNVKVTSAQIVHIHKY